MDLRNYIEHTALKPDLSIDELSVFCRDAIENDFYGVCLPPYYIKQAHNLLEGATPKVISVAGFPMGYSMIPTKVEEVKRILDDGADEVDVVINISAVKNGNWAHVKNEINSVTTAVHMKGRVIKIILETGLLTNDEIIKCCDICAENDVDFLKTSTGFHAEGATLDVVRFLKEHGHGVKIKASGGIRTQDFATELVHCGADRIGTSSGLVIVRS